MRASARTAAVADLIGRDAESEVLDVRASESKPDRGIVKVHTRIYKQDGTLVAEFKRTVLVPRSPEAIEGGASAAEGPVE